jgi:Cu-processing system ATP-binding protein
VSECVSENKSVVQLCDVEKSFDSVYALKPITLTIAPGEVLGLFGHNGAGKSTLMKLILGVIEPSAGDVLTLGHCPTANDSHHYRCQFGYLPENVSFYDQLTGGEVLLYFARLKGFDRSEARRLLADVGLEHVAGRAVKTYSKGMRQRLGLAQALLGNPRLLLLDEPTVGLDPVATGDFYTTVDRLKSGGCAVILCSHVLPGVEAHIDRAMILKGGESLALGSLEQLRSQAALPIEIRTQGLNVEASGNQFHSSESITMLKKYFSTSDSNRYQKWIVPREKKLDVIRRLTAMPELSDIELREPSLEEIYRYYNSATFSSSPNSTNSQASTSLEDTQDRNVDKIPSERIHHGHPKEALRG